MTALAAKHFTAAEVFEVTGVPQQKAYQWDDRGVTVPSRADKLPSSSGDPHLRSIETVYQLYITAALVAFGLGPKHAATAARTFTDQSQPGRPAGRLFERDRTVLCIRKGGSVVINAPYGADFADLSNHGTALVAVDCNKICREVDEAIHKTVSKNRKKT
jgi:hypothetical protein